MEKRYSPIEPYNLTPVDAVENCKAIIGFVQEYLCHGKPNEDLEISEEGTTGLFNILQLVSGSLQMISEKLQEEMKGAKKSQDIE